MPQQRSRPDTAATSLKRETLILPLKLPCLTDKGAVQLIELLHELVGAVEHHYAPQMHRYRRREREQRYTWQSQASTPDDLLF